MADQNKVREASGTNNSMADRSKKSAATRAITSAKVAKLSGYGLLCYKKIGQIRRELEAAEQFILDGGKATADMAVALNNVSNEIAKCMSPAI